MTDRERIEHVFAYHKPAESDVPRIEKLRADSKRLAHAILKSCPKGRETNVALKHVEDACMWAVKAIVLNSGPEA